MMKLVLVPMVLLALLVAYIQFEAPVLRFAMSNLNDGVLASVAVGRLLTLEREDLVVEQLRSPQARSRLMAMRALSERDNGELRAIAPSLMDDPDEEIRFEAITLCGRLRLEAQAVPIVEKFKAALAKGKEGWALSGRCLRALADMKYKPAIPLFQRLLTDKKAGGLLLGKELKQALLDMRMVELAPYYSQQVAGLLHVDEAALYVQALADVDPDGGIPELQLALGSRKDGVRAAAVAALVKVGAKGSIEALRQAMGKEGNPGIRKAMGEAIKTLAAK